MPTIRKAEIMTSSPGLLYFTFIPSLFHFLSPGHLAFSDCLLYFSPILISISSLSHLRFYGVILSDGDLTGLAVDPLSHSRSIRSPPPAAGPSSPDTVREGACPKFFRWGGLEGWGSLLSMSVALGLLS